MCSCLDDTQPVSCTWSPGASCSAWRSLDQPPPSTMVKALWLGWWRTVTLNSRPPSCDMSPGQPRDEYQQIMQCILICAALTVGMPLASMQLSMPRCKRELKTSSTWLATTLTSIVDGTLLLSCTPQSCCACWPPMLCCQRWVPTVTMIHGGVPPAACNDAVHAALQGFRHCLGSLSKLQVAHCGNCKARQSMRKQCRADNSSQ